MADQLFERLKASLADHYVIERELGRGGMATVYLAYDGKHSRRVAVKVLHHEVAAFLGPERFLREIQIAAQLVHPHILPLYDSGEADGALYYIMPFVEGESLRARLNRERQLAVSEALEIAREVADALSYAHSRGVVHRDIKPENILLSDGHALVADFGIARAIGDSGTRQITTTGMIVGTAGYMSPEQATGEASLDGRSDIYSLGCVLYEMLAGEPPYTGPTHVAITAKQLQDPVPSVRRTREAVPQNVDRVLGRALARLPADRFPTAGDFAAALVDEPAGDVATLSARESRSRRTPRSVVIGVGVAVALVVGAVWAIRERPLSPRVSSLAVLPIENLTGDTSQAYVADAMTDQLITDLAQIGSLKVIARASVMQYKGTTKTTRQIAGELGVQGLATASLHGSGEGVHITTQLTVGRTGETLWAQSYDGNARDLPRLEREVAGAIAQHVRAAMTPGEQGRLAATVRAIEPAAYAAYARGRYWWNRRGEPNLNKAIGFFQQALEIDPAYALAYSGLADAYVQLGYGSYVAPAAAFPKARAAATRALELDSTLAEPHASLGFYNLYYEWDWNASDREFQSAFALNPNYATAHEWYSLFLAALGRLPEAEHQASLAADLDPLSVPIASTAGWIAHYAGNQNEAERRLKDALTFDSLYPFAHLYLGRVYEAEGKNEAALTEFHRMGPLAGWAPAIAGMGYVEAVRGRPTEATHLLAELDSIGRTRYVTAYGVALVYAALGDRERAFQYLDRAVQERTHWLVWLNRDFRWDPIRGDSRFRTLVTRVGLPH